jgi:hypothetical protein
MGRCLSSVTSVSFSVGVEGSTFAKLTHASLTLGEQVAQEYS